MINFLVKRFIKNYDDENNKGTREAYGILSGVLGIICNLFLFGVKLTIGFFMNSIAIISDAVNNLSDTGSSIVTVIGFKMSNRNPDRNHPFGHGRIEYISSLIVSLIIMMVGAELLKTSIHKIINPVKIEFNIILVIILSLSLLVKLWMYSYNKLLGNKINSELLKATASDSINDVYATSMVIASIIIGEFVSFPIDGIMGVIVSGLIIYTGFGVARKTIGILLGNSPNPQLVSKINEIILSGEGIIGVHDLIVHDYGPGRIMASAHAEVPDDVNIVKIHEVIDKIEQSVLEKLGIHIVIHMDPLSINCARTNQLKKMVENIVHEINPDYTIHDFRLTDGENNINLIFDMVVPCETKENERIELVKKISQRLKDEDNRYSAVVTIDNSF